MSGLTRFEAIVDSIRSRFEERGLGLCAPFDVQAYNQGCPEGFGLPTFGRSQLGGILVGNHRGLWEPFCQSLRVDPTLLDSSDPLDSYIEGATAWALKPLTESIELRFGHRTEPSPVAMQHLAHVSGLAELTDSHLSVHPVYGPWIALRVAIVIDLEAAVVNQPPKQVCDSACRARAKEAFDRAVSETKGAGHDGIRDSYRAWLALREGCCAGREYRYSEDQILYHYTHDKTVLRKALS